jgi:hypothetical protein
VFNILRPPSFLGKIAADHQSLDGLFSPTIYASTSRTGYCSLLLATVTRQGYIDNFPGVHVSKIGRRFLIEQAAVWNLLDESGFHYGQAATFSAWRFIP